MYFWCSKNSICGLKMSFSVIFRFNSVEISDEKNFFKHFYSIKRFVFEFQGESLELFLSYLAHSAVIAILEDFGSLLPARTVTVKVLVNL